MKKIARAVMVCCALFGILPASMAQNVTPGGSDLILVRPTEKSPEVVVEAIKTYAKGKKWVYMGANKVKPPQGEITFVKVCVPEVSKLIWPLGLQLSAMLPCGNFGVYQNQGKTEISMLHPRYMQVLYPHPEVEKASTLATPLLTEMLEAVAK